MASDRFDDELDDRGDDRPRRRGGRAADGKAKLLGPAIGLIVIAGLMLAAAGINVISGLSPNFGAELDKQKQKQFEQIDANPQVPADQKQQQKDVMSGVFDALGKYWIPGNALLGLANLVVLAGGVQMIRAKSRGLAMFSSVLVMIPCVTSVCCLLGVPIGIWALVTLGKPEVKAAFAGGAERSVDDYDAGRG